MKFISERYGKPKSTVPIFSSEKCSVRSFDSLPLIVFSACKRVFTDLADDPIYFRWSPIF
jgi:hypothetical protein